ncbi:NAD-dependent dehydratase [Haloarcula taiwanensis]|uniref:NAD-dependent dehydratase n=1 Tax=Haloarcula taiwanensis TaxID=1932004 RepID=A0A2H4ZZN6_9EURY|nr:MULTISPECIES: UDP-glucuronic acid decarboxylase family protein [Haloarcula]AUG47900.1 NAD-dependent dehydratase [Haloarcula taiwanensis]RLM39210.1 SDR family NAD-dependent epimerase/dehydratase [Haloarcula sp. Atlit-120R]RLM47155.1 SDR family NAD-dependent epimerase/dehydratase [Haloarcula sp. Atlit-47R]
MNLTTLVAGGGGFLGSHLCTALVEDGHEVICIDNFGSGRRENLAHLEDHPRFMLIEADIREPLGLPAADRVYHLASRASPTDFTEFPVQIALTNTEGTRNLLDYAVKHDARMVYASTSEVYGDPEVHPQPESYTGNVNIRGPRGCYDESKRFGETLTVAYEKRYDIDVRTARIFNTYGPRMRADDGRVVPTFVTQALDGEDLTIYGDGTQTRSFCYVSDMVAGLRALMDQPGLDGEVVNIGRENEITIRTLADRILEHCDTDSDLIFEPLPEDDPERRRPDISKAQKLLNWEPNVSLNEGLRQTISYFGHN